MKLTVWGPRGSIPVSGQQFLRYGGDTTCVEIETATGETVILDAGTGVRALGNKLLTEERKSFHFLLSHAHWDHILGFPFFKPLYGQDTTIHIHGCSNAQKGVKTIFSATMQPPYFPVNIEDVAADLLFEEECPEEIEFCDLHIRTILLNHPNFGYGFRITENGRSLAFFPDNELAFAHPKGGSFDDYARFVEGVDLLIHDAEYLPEEYEAFSRGWGHSVYLDTVRFAVESGVKKLVLWHLNHDRTDDQADAMLNSASEALAESGSDIECLMARTGLQLEI